MVLNLPLFTGLKRALLFNYPRDTLTLNTYLFDRFLQKKTPITLPRLRKKKRLFLSTLKICNDFVKSNKELTVIPPKNPKPGTKITPLQSVLKFKKTLTNVTHFGALLFFFIVFGTDPGYTAALRPPRNQTENTEMSLEESGAFPYGRIA